MINVAYKQFRVLALCAAITPSTAAWASDSTATDAGPCASPAAMQIFSSRMEGARSQSSVTAREHTKTIGQPSISEGAIRKSNQCNDAIRDQLMTIFKGTPLSDILGLLGLDTASCDDLYAFTSDIDPSYNFNVPGGSGTSTGPQGNTTPSQPKQSPTTFQWVPTANYTVCTAVTGSDYTGTQSRIYQCMDSMMNIASASSCSTPVPIDTRSCTISSMGTSSGGVNDAIY